MIKSNVILGWVVILLNFMIKVEIDYPHLTTRKKKEEKKLFVEVEMSCLV